MIYTNVSRESLCPSEAAPPGVEFHRVGPPAFKKTSKPLDASLAKDLKRYVEFIQQLNSQSPEEEFGADESGDDELSELPRAENIGRYKQFYIAFCKFSY